MNDIVPQLKEPWCAYAQPEIRDDDGEHMVVYVEKDEPGYYPTTYRGPLEYVTAVAAEINASRGISEDEAWNIVASSMRQMGDEADTVVLELGINNVYAGGTVHTAWAGVVPAPPAVDEDSDDYQDWLTDNIFDKTGTGQTEGDAGYFVEVKQSSRPDLIPVGKEWEWV